MKNKNYVYTKDLEAAESSPIVTSTKPAGLWTMSLPEVTGLVATWERESYIHGKCMRRHFLLHRHETMHVGVKRRHPSRHPLCVYLVRLSLST